MDFSFWGPKVFVKEQILVNKSDKSHHPHQWKPWCFAEIVNEVQFSTSKMAKNGGPVFSAVCGSKLIPISVPEPYKHRGCSRLLFFDQPGTFPLPHIYTPHPLLPGLAKFKRNLNCSHEKSYLAALNKKLHGALQTCENSKKWVWETETSTPQHSLCWYGSGALIRIHLHQ